MPPGRRGEHRPADPIGAAVTVDQIGESDIAGSARGPFGRLRRWIAGPKAAAEKISKEECSAVALKAAVARWG